MKRPSHEELEAQYRAKVVGMARARAAHVPWAADDIYQQARMALFEASEAFDWSTAEHPAQFLKFLDFKLSESFMDYHAAMDYATTGSRASLGRGKRFHERSTPSAIRGAKREPEHDDGGDDFDAIVSVLHILSEREREVVELYYLDALLTDEAVAHVLGVSQQAVHKTRKRAEEKLRDEVVF